MADSASATGTHPPSPHPTAPATVPPHAGRDGLTWKTGPTAERVGGVRGVFRAGGRSFSPGWENQKRNERSEDATQTLRLFWGLTVN